jgi:hypothetical protein
MAYAIMRTAKLKGAGSISGSIQHAYRERETPNADIERTPDNEVLIQYDEQKCRNDIETGRTRSDNVEVVEFVFTTSPEWMENATPIEKAKFEGKVIDFLDEEFKRDNIQSLIWHKDEKTDHLSAHVTPRDKDGRLNCKEWLGGRKKLRELQDRFADKVKELGLERGERGSKAKHQEISKYYGRIEKAEELSQAKEMPKLTVPISPNDAMTGLYNRAEVGAHGFRVARTVRDQMLERENILLAKVAELESKLVANRGNIVKNETLERELKRVKPYEKYYQDVKELRQINPVIDQEIKSTMEIKRQRYEHEWRSKPPEERLRELDKKIMKEKDPEKYKLIMVQRTAAVKEIGDNRKKQRELDKGRDTGRGR